MAILRATKGLEPGRVCSLESGSTILGRNPKRCDVVLEHFAVSREHARIVIRDNVTYIEDLGSRNGVWVNGQQIAAGPNGRRELKGYDRIAIAAFEFIFEDGSSSTGGSGLIHADETACPDIHSTVDVGCDSSYEGLLVDEKAGRRSSKLRTVLEIIDQLSNTLDVDVALPRIIDALFRALPHAQNGFILLRDRKRGTFYPVAERRADDSVEAIRISQTVIDYLVNSKKAVLSADVANDIRFGRSASVRALQLRSMISTPLVDGYGEVRGIIQLEVTDGSRQFSQGDLELLAGVARHIGIVIENSQLHDAAIKAQRFEFDQRFRRLIEGSLQGILIHREFRPLFVNDAWAHMHGYTTREVMMMPTVAPLIAQEDLAVVEQCAAELLEDETQTRRYDTRGVRKDGSVICLENFSTTIDWDDEPAIQTTIIDLTQRKEAEAILKQSRDEMERKVRERSAELAQSEALYRSLVDHLPISVCRKDLQGRYTFVNRAFCQLLETDEGRLIGHCDADLLPPELAEKLAQADRLVVRTGQSRESIETLRRPDGMVYYLQTIQSPVRDEHGQTIGTQVFFGDVSSLKQTEEDRNRYAAELERSNRDLEHFAYSVSHDLQSPLRTIATYCELLQDRYAAQLDGAAVEFLTSTVEATHRMRNLLNDLLAFSRVTTDARQFEPIDSAVPLQGAIDNVRTAIETSGARIEYGKMPIVQADATQLMQVFQNLIDNAIHYRSEAPPRIRIEAVELPDAWQFSVSDNGVGFEAKSKERIFLIFQRLHAEHELPGSGIGLAICKRILERHGGKIWADSKPGQGSCFSFTLAKSYANQPTAEMPAAV